MAIPKTHVAYRLKGKSLEQLERVVEEVPKPKFNEVLVKIKAVTLNSRDLQVVTGKYPMPAAEDVVPCSDMSGEVVAVGDSVATINVGDRVISNFQSQHVWDMGTGLASAFGAAVDGTLREYMVLSEEAVNKIPNNISWEEAAALVCTGVTSWNALYGLRRLIPGDVVVLQGTGGVSLTALAIAKKAGAVTILTSSSDDKLAKVKKEHGVDYTINYKTTPDWDNEVLKITNGRGADYIIENGGTGTIRQSINCTAPEGIISLIGFVAPRPKKLPNVYTMALLNGVILRGIRVGNKQMAQELIKFVQNKGLNIAIDRKFNFHQDGQVIDAFRLLESSQQVGKICISFDGPFSAKL